MFNKLIAGTLPYMPKKLIWLFSKRYIAGTSIEQAIQEARSLNNDGIMVTFDILGEFIKTLDEAKENTDKYLNLIDVIDQEKVSANCSVKLTMFGLLLDKEKCYQYVRSIVEKAASYNNFVRIDMEDSPCTSDTIEIFRRIKDEFPKSTGLVLQAYMKRTLKDIKDLKNSHTQNAPLNFRHCKGIYVEPADIAYKKYEEINEHYLENLEFMLKNGMYVGIATHDKNLVEGAYKLLEKYKVPKDKYEFQMLFGVTPELRKSIVDKGHSMRIYVPYGEDWFGYSTRRLKENPKMTGHIIKALFVRG